MCHVLLKPKILTPDMFCEELRATPHTLDTLIAAIEDDPVFQNASNTAQMPVEDQLTIMLYHFSPDGNATALQGVAIWTNVGKGTVQLVTQQVMTTIL